MGGWADKWMNELMDGRRVIYNPDNYEVVDKTVVMTEHDTYNSLCCLLVWRRCSYNKPSCSSS